MARKQKIDRGLAQKLDEFEQRLFVLKIDYQKYFSGIDKFEPMRERDDLKRLMREITRLPVSATRQKHRVRSLRARFASMELFWTRQLVQIERGTHPKMKFRADLADRRRAASAGTPEATAPAAERPKRLTAEEREDKAYRQVYDKYVAARRKCGQGDDLAFDSIRDVLKKQVRTIKSRYRCSSVKFRVTVEDGKAKVKAVPLR